MASFGSDSEICCYLVLTLQLGDIVLVRTALFAALDAPRFGLQFGDENLNVYPFTNLINQQNLGNAGTWRFCCKS